MLKVYIAGYQHETNTFSSGKADWSAFNSNNSFPTITRDQLSLKGTDFLDALSRVNIPIGGFITSARELGWSLTAGPWYGAMPSGPATRDAFERISRTIITDLQRGGINAVYLDLHGAAVAEHIDDADGVLISRIRKLVGPNIPIVASLDLHANVTNRMLTNADALAAYRTYPHVDMADSGRLAATLLSRRLARGSKEPIEYRRLPFLIPLPSQSTWLEPARSIYHSIGQDSDSVLNFCMGFPSADTAETAPMIWGYGDQAKAAVRQLYQTAVDPAPWRIEILSAQSAVEQACQLAKNNNRPVIVADPQDNPGAGGDSNTTGLLRALLDQAAGKQMPGQVLIGLIADPQAASMAHAAGIGALITTTVGTAVKTFTGQRSDAPVAATFTVKALSNGNVTFNSPMMAGARANLGLCALLELDGVLIAISSRKKQLLDREMFRQFGVHPEAMKVVVVKSSNHFRADFTAIASHILTAKAAGPVAADPEDLPWTKLAVRSSP